MKISLLTLGTRGDVQPYAVLGQALQNRGHSVSLSTGKNFASFAEEYRIGFVPVEADFQALINSSEGKEMMKNPFLARKHFRTKVQPMMIDALKTFYAVTKDSDAVLFHVKSLGDFFADQFPEKMMRANVVPAMESTREFPNPVFSGLGLPKALNRFTYKLADLGLSMMHETIRQFRISVSLKSSIPKRLTLPSIYGISDSFLPKPPDYPSDSHFTGFWHSHSTQPLDEDVISFLSSGRPTILVTFGSMPFETRFNLQETLTRMAHVLQVQILIVKGWGFENISSFAESEYVKLIANAPYDKLFPRIKAVVHHGGIGTIAECLRAGIPFFSCPVIYPMGDQHFWGMQAHRLGCGIRPVPLKKLTPEILSRSVGELLDSVSLGVVAKRMSAALQQEDGVGNAIKIIESYF